MSELKNDRFLRALLRQPVDRTPVWMMRQAGRYLPEYRATRQQAGSFLDLCKNAELACEVTLQPLRRYPMDAAILFSDILTVPDALGLGLYFEEGEGPRFRKTVRSEADLAGLNSIAAEDDLGYVMNAVRTIRRELNGQVPLIGFSGSPWTLATYMVEGGSSKDFARVKAMAYDQPALMHALLSLLADAVGDYLASQIRAGAQAVQIFDTWGGSLSAAGYLEFSLAYMERVIARLPAEADGRAVPVIVFQGRRPMAERHSRQRRPGSGYRLDDRHRPGAPADRRPGGATRQYGSQYAVRVTRAHQGRGCGDTGRIRQWPGARVQPRPRHHPGCRPRTCHRIRRCGTRTVAAISSGGQLTRNGNQPVFCFAAASSQQKSWSISRAG